MATTPVARRTRSFYDAFSNNHESAQTKLQRREAPLQNEPQKSHKVGASSKEQRSRHQHNTKESTQPQSGDTTPRSSKSNISEDLSKEMRGPSLFKGCAFYLIHQPRNSRVFQSKVKKLRDHGAEICDSPSRRVTHVIVDNNFEKSGIPRALGKANLSPTVKIVNFNWASASIEEGKLAKAEDYAVSIGFPKANELMVKADQGNADSKERVPDELENFVQQVKGGKQVESDDDSASQVIKSHKKTKSKEDWISKFLCVSGGRSSEAVNSNPNQQAITILSMLLHEHEGMGDDFRQLAYRRAITSLKASMEPIRTAKQALKLPGIGTKLAKKIEEIYTTGKLEELDYRRAMGQAQVLDLFQGIYGVGPKIALKWYRQGLRTLDDVRKRTDLTENQRVSLDHYADFQERIPRVEVAEHFDVVRKACEQLDPDVQPYLMGSYRRGQPDCGDIDIILMKPGKGRKDLCAFLYELLSKLFDQDFAKYTFGGYEADSPRWMGATCLPKTNKWRRLDILLVPWGERAGAFIYYTGNEIFNRSIRLLADRKGYHLNEKGLFVKGPAKHQHGPLVEGEDEKRIFEILKVPYREPTERNIS